MAFSYSSFSLSFLEHDTGHYPLFISESLILWFPQPQQVETEVIIVPKPIPNPDCPISLHILVGPNLQIPLSMATPQGRPLFSQPAWSLKNLKAGVMCACPWMPHRTLCAAWTSGHPVPHATQVSPAPFL